VTAIAFPDVFVVSDLHLAAPDDPWKLDPFHSDELFAHFVEHELPRLADQRRSTLILAGDLIDFARLAPLDDQGRRKEPDLQSPNVGSSEPDSVDKVRRVLRGHPRVFRALGSVVARGGQVLVLPGNHDVDLYWPAVWSAVESEVMSGVPRGSGSFRFEPSGMLRSRGIYVEHGHQQSRANGFVHWGRPFVEDSAGAPRLERCWGTFFLDAVYNFAESFAPWLPLVHPTWRAAWLVVKHLGWGGLPPPVISVLVAFLLRHGRRTVADELLGDDDSADQGMSLREIEEELGALESGMYSTLAASLKSWGVGDGSDRDDGALDVGGPVLHGAEESGIEKLADVELRREEVHAVVAGHTHRARRKELTRNGQKKVFLNSGTWTGYLPYERVKDLSHEELCAVAASPEHRRTFVYLQDGGRRSDLLTFTGTTTVGEAGEVVGP
jgi:UDP-2,3-diacylglucosamine pyrophosphatase LpxH